MKDGLNPRQCALKRWLEENFIPARYWTIEEICQNVKMPDGSFAYKLNKDLHQHDKCIQLSHDVRAINYCWVQGYKIIVKDEHGSVKLAEYQEEFNEWWNKEYARVEKKCKYLNLLKTKAERDGTLPFLNQAMNPVNFDKKVDYVEVFNDYKDDVSKKVKEQLRQNALQQLVADEIARQEEKWKHGEN